MPWSRALRYAAPLAIIAVLLALRACTHVESQLATVPREPADPAPAHAGSIDVARGGPVVFGFAGTDRARLVVNGQELAGTPGPPTYAMTMRIVLPAGPAAIRFAAGDDTALIWSPVGRRGGGEYVPASSLSPEPPATATFSGSGKNTADGLFALAILLVIVGSLLALVRVRLAQVPRATWLAIAAVFAAAVAVRWIDLSGFGQTWDEDTNWSAGRNYVTNLLGLDFRAASWAFNYEHPPIMKYLDGIGAQLADGYGPARALSAIWTALGCALLVPIGARLYRLRVGVLAGAIAALLPTLVAHGQVVGHESPTVLWWSLGILLALTAHDDVTTLRRFQIRLGWIGVAIGIAIASRFVNGLLGPLCGAILVLRAPPEWRKRTLIWGATILPIVALATVYAVWPRLWAHPIQAMTESLHRLATVHTPEPFLGDITNEPPAYYFLVYLFATLPAGVLAAVAAFGWRGITERDRAALVVVLWFAVPIGVAISPVRQDGVRYVMPCLTAFAMMAAAGIDFLAKRLPFAVLAGAMVAYLGFVDVRTHPYYLDYFAEQVGGAGTVARNRWFEVAWWGEGVDAGVDYVNEHAAPNAAVYRDCIEPVHLAWFRPDLWLPMAHAPQQAKWLVWYQPMVYPCRVPKDATLVYENVFDGAPFVRVYTRP